LKKSILWCTVRKTSKYVVWFAQCSISCVNRENYVDCRFFCIVFIVYLLTWWCSHVVYLLVFIFKRRVNNIGYRWRKLYLWHFVDLVLVLRVQEWNRMYIWYAISYVTFHVRNIVNMYYRFLTFLMCIIYLCLLILQRWREVKTLLFTVVIIIMLWSL